jgi:carbon dioxide concentrating mechanism protein CcmN
MGNGVILQANPGYYIRIHAGVCLGLGVILHASEGNIIVSSEAILGSGVLVVGWAEVGQRACIGSCVTLINVSIGPGQIVAPGSLLGQRGRVPDSEQVNRFSDRGHSVPGSFSLGHSPPVVHEDPIPFQSPEVSSSRPHSVENQSLEYQSTESQGFEPQRSENQSLESQSVAETGFPPSPPSASTPSTSSTKSTAETSRASPTAEPVPDAKLEPEPVPEPDPVSASPESRKPEPPPPKEPAIVYGKDHFLQMRFAMFPHHS